MKQEKTAVLLMNVGSPDEPKVPAVRKYLTAIFKRQAGY